MQRMSSHEAEHAREAVPVSARSAAAHRDGGVAAPRRQKADRSHAGDVGGGGRLMAAEAKAAGLNSGIAITREMAGAERFDRFVQSLPPELANYVSKPPLATAWLPLDHLIDFHSRAWRELFREDLNAAFEVGRRQFIHDLSTLYKVFIRLGSPGFVSRRAAAVWTTYVRNCGRMAVTREEE